MTLSAPRWTLDQFAAGVDRGIEIFRDERLNEAREDYTSHFEEAEAAIEELLELTVDLTELREHGLPALTSFHETTRYLTAPPTSVDDLVTLSGVTNRSQSTKTGARNAIEMIIALIDRQRFPWVIEERLPTEVEKTAAITATAAQIASRRVMTARANEAKAAQEQLVRDALRDAGLIEIPPRTINTLKQSPDAGEFCGESLLGSRKADIIVGLYDSRTLAIECKVSNSALNSVKRVKNDAGSKARQWLSEFGTKLIVPAAVIAGVYAPRTLVSAQSDGLTIWWSHDIAEMIGWINETA